jgi:hypothetical protein
LTISEKAAILSSILFSSFFKGVYKIKASN